MRRLSGILFLCIAVAMNCMAQINEYDDGFTIVDNSFNPNRALDSLDASHKKVPKRLRVWTIDDKFGDIVRQTPDTVLHLFMNSVFTTGRYGEYNTTGNLGSPRIARIATDRNMSPRFAFTEPLSAFVVSPDELRFTNTLSPITHLYYYSCGDKNNGEDWIKALFATNVNKDIGFGFKFDYMYGRGYYQNQNSSLFDYTMWGSYLGPRYQAHIIFSWDHMKNTENGGITNDEYITHPEAQSQSYDSDEIPTFLRDNWNRNNAFHMTLSHRYNIGFNRKVPMTEDEIEAKRFALQAQKEREELKAAMSGDDGKPKATGRPTDAKVQGNLTGKPAGRPTDAKIVGDLPTTEAKTVTEVALDTIAPKDSLLAVKDTVAADTAWVKDEYVPVTSFIHTMHMDSHKRSYISYYTPADFYQDYYGLEEERNKTSVRYGDDVEYLSVRNNFAIGLLEGFNKYVPMGAKLFIANDIRHYVMTLQRCSKTSYNETDFSAGAQIEKTRGSRLHYKATGEIFFAGANVGDVKVDAEGSLNFPLMKDTVRVQLKGFYHLTNPTFLQRHYHSRLAWWDNDDMSKQMRTHLEGVLSFPKTKTSVRVAYDNIQNYTYLGVSYNRSSAGNINNYTVNSRQTSRNISLFTLMLEQNFKYGILNWENRVTLQKSSDKVVLAVPTLNVWTNLFIDFKMARVLRVNLGAEMFWFTKYNAPEYCGQLGQYAVQENPEVRTQTGGYPFVNAYVTFKIKQCRLFVMMSHLNASMGSGEYFLTPHHPLNESVLRFGLSWTFNN